MAQNRSIWLGCSLGSILAVLLILQTMNQETEGANILGVFPGHGPSHLIVHMSVMKALAERGHNVTTISTIVPKVKHKNIKQIVVPLITAEEEKLLNSGISGMAKEKGSIWSTMKIMVSSMSMMVEKQVELLEHPSFHELYQNKDNKFDVVFAGFFVNSYLVGLGARFNAPVIICWSGAPMLWVNKFLGNPELSTVPQMQIGVAQGETMTFPQRIQNFVSSLSFDALDAYLEIKYKHFYNRIWGSDKSMPSYEEAKQNVSLVFCNSHAISEGPIRANVPAIIEVGGIQIKDKPDPLPQDIKEFLDNAKNGAVLFSLGSNLKGEHIKPDVVDTIFKALSSIKQQVVWKWEDLEKTPGKSSNIQYKKWLPQDDILAHPNIKLFITHAGKGGVSEAQYHGVPMLALPVFGDQPGNADKLALSGYGLRLDLNTMKVEELKEAIKEITENPKYAQKLKSFSQLYRDRPLSAKESVVYWTEYVIRHRGAPHMQSPLVKMSFIASNNYDIYILAVLVLYILLKINKVFWLFIWRKFVAKKTQYTKLKQN